MEFSEWLKAVDWIVTGRLGFGIEDMPDTCTRDRFEDGMEPDEAAEDIMEEWVENGDVPAELI